MLGQDCTQKDGGTNAEMPTGLDRPIEAFAGGDSRGGTTALGHDSGKKMAGHGEEVRVQAPRRARAQSDGWRGTEWRGEH
jgi:hypothetical protein